MGGVGSKQTHVNVVLNTTRVVPGSQIYGNVRIVVAKENESCTLLALNYTGKEHITVKHVSTIVNAGSHSTSTLLHEDTRDYTFSKLDFDLAHFPTKLSQGTYDFPFSLTLPTYLLPSMSCEVPGEEGGGAAVKHSVQASLQRPGWFTWNIVGQANLSVYLPPSKEVSKPLYCDPQAHPIYYMWVARHGDILAGMECPKSKISIEESISVTYAMLNNTDVEISHVEICIVEKVSWSLNTLDRSIETVVASNTVAGPDLPMTTALGQQSHPSAQDYPMIRHMLRLREFSMPLTVSPSAHISMEGSLVSIKHELKLRIVTPFGFTSCVMSRPIEIVP